MNWRKVEVQNSESQIKTLVGDVRSAANKSMEALWNAFMEVGDPDMLRATERALLLMVSHSDYAGAMKVLEGIYALVEIAPPEDFTDCSTPRWRRCSWRNFWRGARTSSLTLVWRMFWHFSQTRVSDPKWTAGPLYMAVVLGKRCKPAMTITEEEEVVAHGQVQSDCCYQSKGRCW